MTDRIAWSRYEGDDIEAFAALCIYRERPRAVRIRPSQGDGGIDIYVMLDDGRVDIYQVKKHTQHLTSQQLYQIKKSYETVKTYAKSRQWRIATWYLLMPLEPTKENDKWLEELNKDDEFDAQWQGLTAFDNWAIDYPKVVDYYFEGGRERLRKELEEFLVTTSFLLPGVDPEVAVESFTTLEPATVLDRLSMMIGRLSDADPHFQYTVAIGPVENPAPEPSGDFPTVVGSYYRRFGDQMASVHVFARFAESLVERPITIRGSVVVKSGSDEEREWTQFQEYGRIPRNPIPMRDLEADFPGGLGDTLEKARIQLAPADKEVEPIDRLLTILNPKGEILAEFTAQISDIRTSQDGSGGSLSGTDRSGILTFEILSKTNGDAVDMTYHFSLGDVTGKRPKDALPAVLFTNSFCAPNRLRVSDPHVPRVSYDQAIPNERPGSRESEGAELYIRYLEALAAIQQYADVEIRIPGTLTADTAMETLRTARLLAGETVIVEWGNLTVTFDPGAPAFDGGGYVPLEMEASLDLEINGRIVNLGRVHYSAAAAGVGTRFVDPEGNVAVTFEPGPDDKTLKMTWVGADSLGGAS